MARETSMRALGVGRREPAPSPPDAAFTEQEQAQNLATGDIDPATATAEEEDEARLPEVTEDSNEAIAAGPLAIGHAAIENAVKLAPTSPGVYRMLSEAHDVL